ncbi:MAG: M23 family metallopeptidase [Clostridia bacterium]|nr:M23 family metallopeptidase [Clostridia bacterium]
MVMLFVKMSADSTFDIAKSCISYTIDKKTDWKNIAVSVKNFIKETVITDETLNEHEALTKMEMPIKTDVISQFGTRTDKNGKNEFHYGVDFAGNAGDKIRSVSDGTVAEIGNSEEYGNFILIKHNDSISSFYGNCEKILPQKNDKIKSGQVIATLGINKASDVAHLHFEIREGDSSLDPMVFLEDKTR